MNKKQKITARIGAVAAGTALLAGMAVPAQAHYDPWNTHDHWNDVGVYRSCSVWDQWFNGCQNRYIVIWNW